MSSFASVVSKTPEVGTSSKTKIIENDEELKHILSSFSKPLDQPPQAKLSEAQVNFIETHSEHIYDMYRDYRECYQEHKLMNVVDYNGFMDIILNNIKLTPQQDMNDKDISVLENDDFTQ